MEQESQPQYVHIRTSVRLLRPPVQVALAVPVAKWDELIDRIKGFKPDFRPWSIAYSISFGIGITAGISIAPLMISGLPTWVVMAYVAISASALAIGVGLVIAERALAKQQSSQIDLLTDEMGQMKDDYLEVPTLAHPVRRYQVQRNRRDS